MSNPTTNHNPATGGDSAHVIIIPEASHNNWLTSMQESVKEPPKSLNMTAGRSSCSIFRVPQSLKKIHPEAFEPRIVSIGPYHQGEPHLKMIDEHKQRFLGAVLARTQKFNVGLDQFFKDLAIKENKIRESYSENIDCSSHELIEMMILDGCFVIQLLCIVGRLVETDSNDPLLILPWILYSLSRDLLLLENQIPFFVLEILFDLSKPPDSKNYPTFTELVLQFFDYTIPRPRDEIPDKSRKLSGEHLLGLFRSSFIPLSSQELAAAKTDKNHLQLIQPVENLRAAGIKLKQRKNAKSFLDIKFRTTKTSGLLEIPTLSPGYVTNTFLLNCVTFEQSYRQYFSAHFTSYVIFMGCLINTIQDAGYLRDKRIIENYFGTDEDVVKFFNKVGKDMNFDISQSYLANVFVDVNEYCRNGWHVTLAKYLYTYFDAPWSCTSAIAALFLLIVTFIQGFFAVYAYAKPPS
ncbi:UPF0481 protein At3g47200 [Manihot esculenta]|uniref:Uncharacterized protein n=1 Tax=Manihot esculenta TaxID=3983 RepID=A0A2C9V1U9_MANES|nr:UPF0481 protein At3g47200 [Manihot esculenta]OAY38162.1 hypothetical protein MANES_11G158400v8 [Manihot esculenta]